MPVDNPLANAAADYGRQFASIYDELFPRSAITPNETAWLGGVIPRGATRIVELGVGTGRVAIPLLASLPHPLPQYVGVDISPEMLEQLTASDKHGDVTPVVGEISNFEYPGQFDAVLCVCGTISMVTDPMLQAQTILRAARALTPGGRLILETHDADMVRSLHFQPNVTYAVPYPGRNRALVTFSSLHGSAWHLEHAWIDDGKALFPSEDSRLTSLDELDSYAHDAGLVSVSHTRGLDGTPLTGSGATLTGVYEKAAPESVATAALAETT